MTSQLKAALVKYNTAVDLTKLTMIKLFRSLAKRRVASIGLSE